MRNALLAALLAAVAAPAAAKPASPKAEFETVVLELLQEQGAPVLAPVKAVPVKSKDVVLARAAKTCRLYGMDRDLCLYRCSDGTEYSRPVETTPWPSDPLGSPRISCPQIVVPF